MPPKRTTRAAARRSTAGQGTLSFSKGQPNKVTKQAPTKPGKPSKTLDPETAPATTASLPVPDASAAPDPLSAPAPDSPTAVLGGRTTSPSPAPATSAEADADTSAALAVPPSRIKSYWRDKERARLAPRVHQQELGLGEKVLREWDMSGQFGPCIGISREGRWRRARALGLRPPIEVLAVLLGRLDAGGGEEERAYVDVLMGNRVEVAA